MYIKTIEIVCKTTLRQRLFVYVDRWKSLEQFSCLIAVPVCDFTFLQWVYPVTDMSKEQSGFFFFLLVHISYADQYVLFCYLYLHVTYLDHSPTHYLLSLYSLSKSFFSLISPFYFLVISECVCFIHSQLSISIDSRSLFMDSTK